MKVVTVDTNNYKLYQSPEEIRSGTQPIESVRFTLGLETPDSQPERFLARITANPGYESPVIAISDHEGQAFLIAAFIRKNAGFPTSRTLKFLLNGLNWNSPEGAKQAAKCVLNIIEENGCSDAYSQLYPLKDSQPFFDEAKKLGLLLNLWNQQTQRLATLYAENRIHPREQISSKRRLRLRKNSRLLESMTGGEVNIETITEPAQVDAFMKATDTIFPNTWQSEKGLGIRDTENWRQTIQLEAEAGRLYSHVLYANHIPIAYQFGTIYGNTFNYEVMGFDNNYAKASPGQLLRIEMLSQLFERKIVGFEMGAGDYEFKQSWSDHSVEIANFQLCRSRPIGLSKYLLREFKTQVAAIIRKLKPVEEKKETTRTNT